MGRSFARPRLASARVIPGSDPGQAKSPGAWRPARDLPRGSQGETQCPPGRIQRRDGATFPGMSITVESDSALHDMVDAAVDAYVRWREECAGARDAYDWWLCAAKDDRALASCAYVAALDREEIAASVYEAAMRRLGHEFADGPLAKPRRLWGGCAS